MAYTKSTDFAIKDNLLSGNPSKLVRGSEIDAEFNALEVEDALNLKTAAAPSSFVERSGANVTLGSVAGTNTITAAATPTLSAYSSGQTFRFTPTNTNTGAVTLNIDSIGAVNIKKRSSGGLVALVANDLIANQGYSITRVGTDFVLNESRSYAQGADVASASTINLDTATGDYVVVTGTTTITAVTLAQGEQRTIRFSGALTFTNGASLILPGGSNITTAAGDVAVLRGEASSVVRCVSYVKANGTSVVDAAVQIQPISASVGSNQLTISFSQLVLDFRSTTLGSGTVTRVTGIPANLVISNGSTLGTTDAIQSDLAVVVMNNAGTLEAAVVNMSGGVTLDEQGLISTTAEGGLGAADSATVIYSTTARSSLAYRVVGLIRSTQATAGAWVTAPSLIQGVGGQAFTAMSSLGYGQTWQNVTGSRSAGTTYYNTTGKPIVASITNSAAAAYAIVVNGVNTSYSYGNYSSAIAVIPVGATYLISASAVITNWAELR